MFPLRDQPTKECRRHMIFSSCRCSSSTTTYSTNVTRPSTTRSSWRLTGSRIMSAFLMASQTGCMKVQINWDGFTVETWGKINKIYLTLWITNVVTKAKKNSLSLCIKQLQELLGWQRPFWLYSWTFDSMFKLFMHLCWDEKITTKNFYYYLLSFNLLKSHWMMIPCQVIWSNNISI